MHVGVIMSTPEVFSTLEGYHVYARDFGTNEKKPQPDFEDFCYCTFCDYAVVYVGFWNIRQLIKISPSGSQNGNLCSFSTASS